MKRFATAHNCTKHLRTWRMASCSRTLLLSLLLAGTFSTLAAGAALPKQLQQIESLQHRAHKMTFGVPGANNYHLAKARTWLDLAVSEYYGKDDSGLVSAAIMQSETLLDALEKKQTGITMDTPRQILGSEALRPDLWDKIAVLKGHNKFFCGQRMIAEAEVYLVWAGHENYESGASHARIYLAHVEKLIDDVQVTVDNCTAAPDSAITMLPPKETHIIKIWPTASGQVIQPE